MRTTPTYKQLVAAHLQDAADRHGYTRQQLAEAFGLANGNFISMVMSPKSPALMPVSHLPALARLCRLSARQRLQLMHRRVVDHPERPLHLTTELFHQVLASTVELLDARRHAENSTGAVHA
jgi:hypothetical protein